ncbi:hypothetical protein [Nocardia vinacea]|uniref:hypothetical protein n=1 Tax=Nocardia vinacea TaxID=96468 RepID=UPI00030AF91B|nr:hypothetical protein [Nocardia vinacea]
MAVTAVRRISSGFVVLTAVVALGGGSLLASGAAGGAPGDVTTTVTLSGQAATGCTAQVKATVAGSSSLGLGNYIPPVEFWDDGTFLGSVTPTVNKATPSNGVSLTAQVDWKPATTGNHTVRAKYVGGNYTPESEGSVVVRVGTGTDLGSACLPIG